MSSGQVLGSILGFGAIYFLLFVIWLIVLNNKIQAGPVPLTPGPGPSLEPIGFLNTASERPEHVESLVEEGSGSRSAS